MRSPTPAVRSTKPIFCKLLVAQIQYQDPMNPQSDTQMAAQLAQFTSLQQATETSSSLAMMQASSLIGSTVTVQVDSQSTASGVVSGVVLNNGTPQISIGGNYYNLGQVISVTPTQSGGANPPPGASAKAATLLKTS